MSNWFFPKSQGQIRGVADAGIETFNGKELKSLAREICQNSLDAANNEDNPVTVEFYKHNISTSLIPGYETYKDVIDKSLKYWTNNDIKKAIAFLNSASKSINFPQSSVLRISDYNTKGLENPYTDDLKGWNSLTKLDGGATKSGDSAGSFGIGKNAPFSNSYLRLVFYRTLNQAGERAAQGISRLFSYPEDLDNAMATMKSGFGYYGDNSSDNSMPVPSIPELDSLEERKELGSDVFVYGFKNSDKSWESELIESLLDNFVVAYYKGKLETKVQKNETINKASLQKFLKDYKCIDSENIFLTLDKPADDISYFERTRDFHGMGTLVLKLLIDPKKKLNKKILVVRKAGMRLFWLPKISNMINYTGVLELQGKELNTYFGSMETPSHDKWEYKRHEDDPAEAKAYYDELKQWVNDVVFELSNMNNSEETIVEGLSSILNEDLSENGEKDDKDKEESLNNLLGKIEVVEKRDTHSKGFFHPAEDQPSKKTEKGTIGKGDDDAIRKLKGKKKRKKRKSHRGAPDPEGKDLVTSKERTKGGLESKDTESLRLIKTGGNSYRVSIVVPVSIGSGHIEITTVGENGRTSLLKINSAEVVSGCNNVYSTDDTIEFTNMTADLPAVINFTLASYKNYAMEVNVYEHS